MSWGLTEKEASDRLGRWQERRANKAIEKLLELVTLKANVMRDGQEEEIPSEEVVPGDIVVLAVIVVLYVIGAEIMKKAFYRLIKMNRSKA